MDYLTAAILLFMIGAVLLVAEAFLPTGGFLVVASLVFFALGVAVIFVQGTTTEAAVAVAGVALGVPVAGVVAVSAWKRLSLDSMINEDLDTQGVSPSALDLAALKNHVGKTVSPMRPSGSIEIEGRRIDAMSEGVMLEAGVWVRCVAVRNGKVIVRQIESPADMVDIDSGRAGLEDISAGPPQKEPPTPEPKKAEPTDFDDFNLDLDR